MSSIYTEILEELKGKSIMDELCGCAVDTDRMTDEQLAYWQLDKGSCPEVWELPYADIYANDLEDCAIWDDTYELTDFFDDFLKKANRYLVWANGVRWDGASGYKFVDSVRQAFGRDYDATFILEDITPRGKVMTLSESSHDVPMGDITYVIALTERESERLRYADFETVEKFVQRLTDR